MIFQKSIYCHRLFNNKLLLKRNLQYIQGQEITPKVREYFYYIDHQGMLYLDDARIKNFTSCFKEKKFLEFFFKRLRINRTEKYEDEFPYISPCGRERNYVNCDDVPIVYTHILKKNNTDFLTYGYADDLLIAEFMPHQIFMLPATGRIYHPAEDKCGGVGLVRSKLAIEFSKNFEFRDGEINPPTHFHWNNRKYELDKDWFHEKLTKNKISVKTTPN